MLDVVVAGIPADDWRIPPLRPTAWRALVGVVISSPFMVLSRSCRRLEYQPQRSGTNPPPIGHLGIIISPTMTWLGCRAHGRPRPSGFQLTSCESVTRSGGKVVGTVHSIETCGKTAEKK